MGDTVSDWIFWQLASQPLLGLLLILIGTDVASGWMIAAVKRQLNSTTSLVGMSRKVMIVLLVGVARIIEPHAAGMPVTNLVAGCYCATELLSILENAIALGVPVPKVLRDVLKKFADEAPTELEVPAQTIVVKRLKRPSDLPPELIGTGPPPKQTGDSEGASQPSRPS